jgi:hypothetical protein
MDFPFPSVKTSKTAKIFTDPRVYEQKYSLYSNLAKMRALLLVLPIPDPFYSASSKPKTVTVLFPTMSYFV